MLNFIKKLFGSNQSTTVKEETPAPAPYKPTGVVDPEGFLPKEFHVEMREQVEAESKKLVETFGAKAKTAKKPTVKKATTRKAPAKITAEKKPAKKPAKKSK